MSSVTAGQLTYKGIGWVIGRGSNVRLYLIPRCQGIALGATRLD